jgi:hypothetical protein
VSFAVAGQKMDDREWEFLADMIYIYDQFETKKMSTTDPKKIQSEHPELYVRMEKTRRLACQLEKDRMILIRQLAKDTAMSWNFPIVQKQNETDVDQHNDHK